jgi:hypothetical protein
MFTDTSHYQMENELTDQTDEIWGELGEPWWREAGATVQATEQQIIFAACRHKGMNMTASAKVAQYGGDETGIRQSGHRAAHSTAVCSLLSLAAAETGRGPDGNVTLTEARQILSRLARNAEPLTRIKAIESLARIERDERDFEARRQESATSLQEEIREICKISPELAEAYAIQKGIAWNGGTNE